jgi:hypothetical protein
VYGCIPRARGTGTLGLTTKIDGVPALLRVFTTLPIFDGSVATATISSPSSRSSE